MWDLQFWSQGRAAPFHFRPFQDEQLVWLGGNVILFFFYHVFGLGLALLIVVFHFWKLQIMFSQSIMKTRIVSGFSLSKDPTFSPTK